MTFEEQEIVAEDWDYRTEGGQHLVFSYEGHASHLLGKILRVRSLKKTDALPTSESYELCDEAAASESLMKTGLHTFLLRQIELPISSQALRNLRRAVQDVRPLERVETNIVPVQAMHALVQDDLARFFGKQTLCVEVNRKVTAYRHRDWCHLIY
eukprot:IDg8632t1